ncbi:Glucosamine-phosphate N-acetyltransferase-like protein [Ciborinia camelliae]|nr:Glucosamine-phosphate N-acetyltransferase-like protein [Ciborinia camelliae]
MASEIALFSNDLISEECQNSLPEGYKFRALQRSDFHYGYLGVLRDLAYVGPITEEQWEERFDAMNSCENTYFVLVIVKEDGDEEAIIGTGTLVVEMKFLGNLGLQGHVEDVCISADHQGQQFGTKLIKALDHIAAERGCYKSILDCGEAKRAFYAKCGYEGRGYEMHMYHDPESEAALNGV